jgi:hypothetical protein
MGRPRMQRVVRGLFPLVSSVAMAALSTVASADDLTACNAALVHGQELARAGKLLAARGAYPACLRAECDDSLRAVCANFVAELKGRIPSVTVEARGPRGHIDGARIHIDGLLVAEPSAATEIDPGEHVVVVEAPGFVAREEHVVVAERDPPRSMPVILAPFVLHGPSPATPSVARTGLPAFFWVAGGGAVAALGSFTYFGLRGKDTEGQLRASCPLGPCDSSTMRREYLAADISLGVAIVAAGAALWIALAHHEDAPPTPSSVVPARGEAGEPALHWVF